MLACLDKAVTTPFIPRKEDAIGVAGGVNLDGYGARDPVNNSDPFGLCPEELTGRPCNQPLAVRNMIAESAANARIGTHGTRS